MNFELDDLLDMVDEWKFKLHDKLKAMTEQERAAFWKEAHEKARKMGLPLAEERGQEERGQTRRKTRKTRRGRRAAS